MTSLDNKNQNPSPEEMDLVEGTEAVADPARPSQEDNQKKQESEPTDGGDDRGDIADLKDNEIAQYVTFYIEEDMFALPMESVLEIIRVPRTVRVPLTPPSLLGLANLRGTVLPILETRQILALPEAQHDDATRVMVADCGRPVGLVVDRVERVLSVEKSRIESADSVQATVHSNLLTGVVKSNDGGSLLQLLDVSRIVNIDFDSMLAEDQTEEKTGASGRQELESEAVEEEDTFQMVSFMVNGEEYGLEITEVDEIVRVPEEITKVPRVDHQVLGLTNLRDRLLSLVSLRRMFNLPEVDIDDRHRIVVVNLKSPDGARESVGIVVDEVREVLTVSVSVREQLPNLLSRGGEFNDVSSVCRLEDGERLVSVLSSSALFQNPSVQAALSAGQDMREQMNENVDESQDSQQLQDEDEIQLVVFNLAGEEYGAMIETVSEIIRVPEDLTRVPKTADFIDGMVNLRGAVLPVMDMRARFGIERIERNDGQRILVLYVNDSLTGFIVDSVIEVLRVPRSVLETSPSMSADQTRIMGQVANLKDAQRMIMVLNIIEMFSDHEKDTLIQAAA